MTRPCGSVGHLPRRQFLVAGMSLPFLTGAAQEPKPAQSDKTEGALGVPGPWPGRVIEVQHPGLVHDGVRNQEAMRNTLERGLKELTGADDAVSAWRRFVEPGDVVGIKVVPNGHPMAPTSHE